MSIVDVVRRERNTKSFTAGQTIFHEGDPADRMYYVEQGEVEIHNQHKFLELVEADGIFGEMGLINNKPRSATATAKTDCRIVELNQGDFYFLIQHVPFFAIKVMQVLSERVRRNTEC